MPDDVKLYGVADAAQYIAAHGRECSTQNVKYHYHRSKHLKGELIGHTLVFTQAQLDDFIAKAPRHNQPRTAKESTEL